MALGKSLGFLGTNLLICYIKSWCWRMGWTREFSRPFPILCLYGKNDILKNANLCLLIVLNQVLKDGINIKSRTLKGFFPLLIVLSNQATRSECCWIHEHLQRIIGFSGQLHKTHVFREQFQQLPNPMSCFLMLILVFSPLESDSWAKFIPSIFP